MAASMRAEKKATALAEATATAMATTSNHWSASSRFMQVLPSAGDHRAW